MTARRCAHDPSLTSDTIVLLSGGVDSIVLAEMALREGRLSACLNVDYGQPAGREEYLASRRWCHKAGVDLETMTVGMDTSSLCIGIGQAGARVVGGRNAILCSLAANLAVTRAAGYVWYGATHEDQDAYRDCRVGWIVAMDKVLFMGYGIHLSAPIVGLTRPEIVKMAEEWGLDLDQAWSCYQPTREGVPCGECDACKYR